MILTKLIYEMHRTGKELGLATLCPAGGHRMALGVNPVRNSSRALNPAGIILKPKSAAATGLEGLWPGGSSGALFLKG